MMSVRLFVAPVLVILFLSPAAAQDMSIKGPPPPGWRGEGVVKTPESSVVKPDDAATGRNHTNTKIFVPIYPSTSGNQPGKSDDSAPAK